MKVWYITSMKLKNKTIIFICTLIFFKNVYAAENHFEKAKKLFDANKIDKAKFLFQKNLVFNPKNASSYLYLAKIFEIEENEKEKEKNIKSTLLLDPKNEEAMFMLIDVELKRSNFSKVKELNIDFQRICVKLCEKTTSINERLKNFDTSNES